MFIETYDDKTVPAPSSRHLYFIDVNELRKKGAELRPTFQFAAENRLHKRDVPVGSKVLLVNHGGVVIDTENEDESLRTIILVKQRLLRT